MKHALITLLSLEALEAIEMARDQNHKYQEVVVVVVCAERARTRNHVTA